MGCEQGKRSILVDLKDPAGVEIAHRLVERADIVHHNMTKGVPERLGIDYETLRKVKPDLIYCNTFMYGPDGPLSHLGGQDSLAQALVGWEWEAGPAEEGNDPLWYRFGHGDASNALSSVVGVLIALAHRDRTGEGQYAWSSLLNGAAYLSSEAHLTEQGASNPPKLDKNQTGFGPLYRLYETQDGWIQLAAVGEGVWGALCSAIERPELETDDRFSSGQRRQQNRGELEALLEPVFGADTALNWRRRLDARGVPVEISVNTFDGESVLFDDENLRLGLVAETDHPSLGCLRQVGSLVRFSDTPSTVFGPPPVSGQHTVEIMRWLGYDEAAVEEFVARGLISLG
jgi:crotonobetainyl-CoA:carnitine CoA-transferase CaiB-like acyl-CoA transferase